MTIVGLIWLVIYLAIEVPLGDRGALLPLVGGGLIYYYLAKRRRPRPTTLLLAGAIALFGLAVLGGSRNADTKQTNKVATATALWQHPGRILDPILKGADGAEAPDLAAALTVVPQRIDYTWGASSLGDLFIRPIPRALWPAKPLIPRGRVSTMLWGRLYTQGTANPEFSVLLYPYMDFGLPGVLLMMILLGVLARAGYEYLKRHQDSLSVALLFSVALPMLVMAVRDSPVDIVARAVFWVLPIYLAFRWASRVSSSEVRSTPSAAALR